MFRLFLNFVLMLLSLVLFGVLIIPALITSLIVFFANKKIKEGTKSLSIFFLAVAVAVDQLGNVFCSELLNITLQRNGYEFGNPDETISGVLGKNKIQNTLTKTGRILDFILDKLDQNHSIKSIEADEG